MGSLQKLVMHGAYLKKLSLRMTSLPNCDPIFLSCPSLSHLDMGHTPFQYEIVRLES